jgi:hypothetical protein
MVLQKPHDPRLIVGPNFQELATKMFGSEVHLHVVHLLDGVLGKVWKTLRCARLGLLQTLDQGRHVGNSLRHLNSSERVDLETRLWTRNPFRQLDMTF